MYGPRNIIHHLHTWEPSNTFYFLSCKVIWGIFHTLIFYRGLTLQDLCVGMSLMGQRKGGSHKYLFTSFRLLLLFFFMSHRGNDPFPYSLLLPNTTLWPPISSLLLQVYCYCSKLLIVRKKERIFSGSLLPPKLHLH